MKKWISVLLAVTIAVSSAAIAFAASSETGDYGKLILNLDAASGYEIPMMAVICCLWKVREHLIPSHL